MTTWYFEYEVEIDDELLKMRNIHSEELEILEAIKSFDFVKEANFSSGISKERKQELDSLYTTIKRRKPKTTLEISN